MSLIELAVAMTILTIVLAALTQIAVSGSSSELALRNQFTAQSAARTALDRLRLNPQRLRAAADLDVANDHRACAGEDGVHRRRRAQHPRAQQ